MEKNKEAQTILIVVKIRLGQIFLLIHSFVNDKYHHQSNLGEERVNMSIWVTHSSSLRKFRSGVQVESMQEYCLMAGFVAGSCLVNFLIYPGLCVQRLVLPVVGWTLLQQLLIKKIYHRYTHKAT